MYPLYEDPKLIPIVIVMALLAYLWGKNGDLKRELMDKDTEAQQERAKREHGNS